MLVDRSANKLLLKLLRTNPRDTVRVVVYIAVWRLFLGIFAATSVYYLAVVFLGPLVIDDQRTLGWLDDVRWYVLVVFGIGGFTLWLGVRSGYRAVKATSWPRPLRAVGLALTGASSVLALAYVFAPFLVPGVLLISLMIYGGVLLGMGPGRSLKYLRLVMILVSICWGVSLTYCLIGYLWPIHQAGTFVDAVWLPGSDGQNLKMRRLPTDATAQFNPLYGRLLLLHGEGAGTYPYSPSLPIAIYEARANAWFNPAYCPNIANIEEIAPRDCRQIGIVHGAKVYAISRSLPLGDFGVYTQFGSTAIYFNLSAGDEKYALEYLKTFRRVESNRVAAELANNKQAVNLLADQLKQKHETLAERLPFNTLLPSQLPQGWILNSGTRVGPELDHPNIQEIHYKDRQGHGVRIIVVPQTGFSWQQGACGPVPYEQAQLNCYPTAGQNYYYANKPGYWYAFRTIGDAVAITSVGLQENDFTTGAVGKILKAANDISDSLKPVPSSQLPKVEYIEGLGQN